MKSDYFWPDVAFSSQFVLFYLEKIFSTPLPLQSMPPTILSQT